MSELTPKSIDQIGRVVADRYAGLVASSDNPAILKSFEAFMDSPTEIEPLSEDRLSKIEGIKQDRVRSAKAVLRIKKLLGLADDADVLRESLEEGIAKAAEESGEGSLEDLEDELIAGFELIAEGEEGKLGIRRGEEVLGKAERGDRQSGGSERDNKTKSDEVGFLERWDEVVLGDKPDDFDTYNQLSDRAKGYFQDLTMTVKTNLERVKETGRQQDLLRQLSNKQREVSRAARAGEISAGDFQYYTNAWSKYIYTVEKSMSEREFKRLGTLDAFMEFAKNRNFLGDYEHADEAQKERIDKRVKRMLEVSSFDTEELREDFETFSRWFRGWWIGELSDVMDTNPNSFISGLGQITATLVIQGLETDRPIISILGSMDARKPSWKKLVGETIGQLQAMGAVNNRERVYAQVKNIAPEKVAEAMVGIANKSAGRGESLALTPDSWKALFDVGNVPSSEENGRLRDTFGETFRKALALYLARDVDVLEGDLTIDQLDKCGIEISDNIRELAMANEYDPITGYGFRKHTDKPTGVVTAGHVVAKNIFPIEMGDVHSSDFVKKQRERIVEILKHTAGSEKAAKLAEKLAFGAIEAGYVGAQLDYLGTSKEAMYKLVHTRRYRYKYLFDQKEAGLPLSADDIEMITLPYFDMVMLPVIGPDGNKMVRENPEKIKYVSFRDYILGNGVERRSANEIPITQAKDADLDYYFYDQMTMWGTKIWNFLINGLDVPWHNLMMSGLSQSGLAFGSKNEDIDKKHVHTLQEVYKYIGYWTSSMTVEQARAFIQPLDENSPVRTWAWEARIPKGKYTHEGEERAISDAEFQKRTARLVFRRMILRELQQYGSKYNDALKIVNPFISKHGVTLSAKDMEQIEYVLLEGVSKMNLVENIKDDTRFNPLFTKKLVESMFFAAGLTDAKATWSQLMGVATEVATRWKLLEEARR